MPIQPFILYTSESGILQKHVVTNSSLYLTARGPTISLLGAYLYLMEQSDLQQYSLKYQPEKQHSCSAGELPANRCSAVHFSDTEHGHSSTSSLFSQVKQVLSTSLTTIINRCELAQCHDFYYHWSKQALFLICYDGWGLTQYLLALSLSLQFWEVWVCKKYNISPEISNFNYKAEFHRIAFKLSSHWIRSWLTEINYHSTIQAKT